MTNEKQPTLIEQSVIDDLKSNIDCRKYISESLSLYGKDTAKEWSGACPWCNGTDRFHVVADGWWCREGNGHCGRKGDIICFVQSWERLNFVDAINHLLKWQGGQPLPATRPRKQTSTTWDWRCDEWQRLAGAEIAQCQQRLQYGAEYLTKRGITLETAIAYRLGYGKGWYGKDASGQHDMRPAISIPWFDSGVITAVRYRFLNPDPDGKKYNAGKFPKNSSGSTGEMMLFRPPAKRSDTAVFVEGEFNAMSIYQVTGYDAYATGSQSLTQAQLDAIRQTAAGYDGVLVWMDEADVARKIAAVVPGAMLMKSPQVSGQKYDANKLLQTGQLAALLDKKLTSFLVRPPVRPVVQSDAQPNKEKGNTPAHRMLALSNQLGFTWKPLPDGRIWLSRWDKELFAQARQLLAQEVTA